MRNTFGNIFRITSFGESHGVCIGGVIDGYPSNVEIDIEFIQSELDRRKPGQNKLSSPRNESDKIEILSGLFNGKSTGAPIAFIIKNNSQISKDYSNIKDIYRPNHADFTYDYKYGIRDYRGGGRSSARETISRVVAGAFAKIILNKIGIEIIAYTSQVGNIKCENYPNNYDLSLRDTNDIKCPNLELAKQMENLILDVKSKGDTIGGTITCVIKNCPIGLGNPVFGKLHSDLGNAMLSINAAKGFDYGSGFDNLNLSGSEQLDEFEYKDGQIITKSNNSGGIQGGISNGNEIYFRVAFKPVPTILQTIRTINKENKLVESKLNGRHDSCVLSRAIPIVESMAAIVLLDNYLLNKCNMI